MASSGKKGKKNKGTVISLQSFLSNGDTPAGTTQVAKKVRNLEGDDSDDGSNALPQVYQLPTAPRANRIFDDESIPHKQPFIAYVNNLPFDANEEDIYEFFGSINLLSLRLPREDGDTGRSRGFGYIELESREDLIYVLSLPDPSIKGRRIRIELSNENEQQTNRQRINRRFDGFGNSSETRDSGNWRRDNQNNGGFSGNYDRGFNRERDRKTSSDDSSAPGSWRSFNRPAQTDYSPPQRDLINDRFRDGRNRNYDRDERSIKEEVLQERPKLNLKPRTLPLPEIISTLEVELTGEEIEPTNIVRSIDASVKNVFGSAKPVDTAARELAFEERLAETRRQDKLRQEKETEESVDGKFSELHISKTDKENANSPDNWRRRKEVTSSSKDFRKKSPERLDDRNRDNKDEDHQKCNKNLEQNERYENPKSRCIQHKESKNKEDIKSKREHRTERQLPKLLLNESGPVLQSSNKYSGLVDEDSD